jgi:ribonuclease Z
VRAATGRTLGHFFWWDGATTLARDYGHLTAGEAAKLAAASDVKQLVLTHISGRYPDEEVLAEAAKAFPNSRIAADFDRLVI